MLSVLDRSKEEEEEVLMRTVGAVRTGMVLRVEMLVQVIVALTGEYGGERGVEMKRKRRRVQEELEVEVDFLGFSRLYGSRSSVREDRPSQPRRRCS